jgi:hypothetical protein
MSQLGHQCRFKRKPAHFRFSPDCGRAASYRSATKSADARRGAAHGGELRQAAGAVAAVAADKRGVTRSHAMHYLSRRPKPKFIQGFALAGPPVIGFFLSFKCRTRATRGAWPCFLA